MNILEKKEIRGYILEYLKKRIPEFKKKGKMFTCPICKNEKLTANIFPECSGKIHCFEPSCKFKGDIFDIAKIFDFDGDEGLNDDDIAIFLKEEFKIQTNNDVFNLLKKYESWKFDLVPVSKNSKASDVEKEWQFKSHKDISEWEQWLVNGLNIGVKTGKLSNIIIVDADLIPGKLKKKIYEKKASKEEIEEAKAIYKKKYDKLKTFDWLDWNTVIQKSFGGVHFFYIYDKEVPKCSFNHEGIHFDIEAEGGQVVIEPSIVGGYKRKISGEEIKLIPSGLKEFIFKAKENLKSEEKITDNSNIEFDVGTIKGLDGKCNSTFVKILGQFRKFMPTTIVERCGHLINREMLDDPMPSKDIRAMCQQINKYHQVDIKEISNKIIHHMKIVNEAHIRDLKECLVFDRGDLEQAIKSLCEQRKIYKIKKDLYRLVQDVEWRTDFLALSKPLSFKVPYFDEYARFNNGSLIVIGAKTGTGKTHLAVNFIEQFVKQGICPKIITTEADSGIGEIALARGLKEGDFKFWQTANPLQVPFYPNEVRIIDWLKAPHGEHFKTDTIYEELANQLVNYGGLLIVFAQLKKENGRFYAEDMVEQFSSLVSKFLYPMVNGEIDNLNPYLDITKARRSKSNRQWFQIPLKYLPDTKEVVLK